MRRNLDYHYFVAGVFWGPFAAALWEVFWENWDEGTVDWFAFIIIAGIFALATYGGHVMIQRIWGEERW